MSKLETRTTRLTVAPKGEPIYHVAAWTVEIEDESGGEFVVVKMHTDRERVIRIDPHEWEALRDAIDRMVEGCRT